MYDADLGRELGYAFLRSASGWVSFNAPLYSMPLEGEELEAGLDALLASRRIKQRQRRLDRIEYRACAA